MAIIGTSSPADYKLGAAYRPIYIIAIDDGSTGLPPEVYCDIYFFGIYYKTISTNVPLVVLGTTSFWSFDISGICQEFIQTMVYDVTLTNLAYVYGPSIQFGMAFTWCKIRISTVDSYGVLTPGGPVPVEATYNTAAIPGGGYITDTEWYGVNATLQIQDMQTLEYMLANFRISGLFDSFNNVNPAYRVYQLSYKTKDSIYLNDWGQMPIITCFPAFLHTDGTPLSTTSAAITILAYDNTDTLRYQHTLPSFLINSGSIYTLPVGFRNVAAMFPMFIATAYYPITAYYRIGLLDPALYAISETLMYVTPKIYLNRKDGVSPGMTTLIPSQVSFIPKHTRIWFKNYLGQLDALNFVEREEQLKVNSSSWEVSLTEVPDLYNYNLDQWNRSNQSRGRMNVRSSEVNTITGLFTEDMMPFLKQLFATSQAFLEFISPDSEDAEPTTILVPIVIQDSGYDTLVFEGRYEYRVTLQYIPSNENIIVR